MENFVIAFFSDSYLSPPCLCMIKYVIVDKGGGVDHLGDDGDHPLALLGLAHLARVHVEGVPDAHRDHRTEALASSVKVVLRHLTQLSVNLRRHRSE